MSTPTLPQRAQIVVIGGGVMGTSVAYHLTKLGRGDVVLLEQGQLSCGTTWHAAGLVGQLRASESGTRLVQYSTQLYAELEAETGLSAGYKQCGGVTVARTQDRMIQLRRTAASAAAYDLECELLSPEQAFRHYPVMRTDDLVGAIWLPADGKANPTDLTMALAKGARQRGARVFEHVRVLDVLARHDKVSRFVDSRDLRTRYWFPALGIRPRAEMFLDEGRQGRLVKIATDKKGAIPRSENL